MRTNANTNADVELDFLSPFTYSFATTPTLTSWELQESESESESAAPPNVEDAPPATESIHDVDSSDRDEGSASDLGYFLGRASRFPLLDAEDERRLGLTLWRCRRTIVRLLRHLRRLEQNANASARESLAARDHGSVVTASTRRRLARCEALARRELSRREEFPEPMRRVRAMLESTFEEMNDARRTLVEHNLRLVVWVAKRFRGRGFDFIDVIQEGNLGLMRAIDRYDPLVGTRFSTFATHWIQQGIRRALAERSRVVRIPVNRIPEAREALAVRGRLSNALGRAAQAEEIAKAMGVEPRKIKELLPAMAPVESIDAKVAYSERTVGELLPDRNRKSPVEHAILDETRRSVREVLAELPQRQRIILAMRHGIGYPKECTLEEIGEVLGLSRERIRQVEKTATATVREWIRKNRSTLAAPV
jgi:RNA polymerase primary sigma factor